jgi:predicted dehydrogenase
MKRRGAFIGFGNVARNGHLPGWLARGDVEMVAAADPVGGRAGVWAAAAPGARFYNDPARMLEAEDLDFIDICTPPGHHAAAIRLAHGAGVHVLCEKPTVTRAADLETAAALARPRGLILHSVHNWLKAPVCHRITTLIEGGALGPVRKILWETLRSQPAITVTDDASGNWRADPALAGGGILFDHGWHALYCVTRWAGAAPQTVGATLERRKYTKWPLEDTATVELGFAASSARIHLTWAAPQRANRIEIAGEKGRLSLKGEQVILTTDEGRRQWRCPPPLTEGSHHPDWFAAVADDFIAAIAAAGRGNEGNLAAALLCAQMIETAQASNTAGGEPLAL